MRLALAIACFALLVVGGYSIAAGDKRIYKGSEPPPKGYARLYVFRPGFSDVSRNDNPILSVNGVPTAELAYETFTSLIMDPGTHEVSTTPNAGESDAWNGSFRISVGADETYFLAVWNDIRVGAGSLSGVTPYLGLLGAVIDHSASSTAVRFEVVNEKDAASVLRELSYVAPKNEHIRTKP